MDPLRPFADLIRNWLRTRESGTERANAVQRPSKVLPRPAPKSGGAAPRADLRRRLKSRLTPDVLTDPQRARSVFVEAVVCHELGDDLARDPAFSQLVSTVTERLAQHPQLAIRLQQLLRELAA